MADGKRTPGPWMWTDDGHQFALSIRPAGTGFLLASVPRDGSMYGTHPACPGGSPEANAAYIVRACNAHDGLVEALRDLITWFEDDHPASHDGMVESLTKARAALRAAEE